MCIYVTRCEPAIPRLGLGGSAVALKQRAPSAVHVRSRAPLTVHVHSSVPLAAHMRSRTQLAVNPIAATRSRESAPRFQASTWG